MAIFTGFRAKIFDGTTEVEMVPAPPENTRRIVTKLTVYNADSVAHTPNIRQHHDDPESVAADEEYLQVVPPEEMESKDWVGEEPPVWVLNDPKKSIVGELADEKTTTMPQYTTMWLDEPM